MAPPSRLTAFFCLGIAGLIVSLYALYVEYKHETEGSGFQALCDLSETVSCSKVRLFRERSCSATAEPNLFPGFDKQRC